VLVDTRLTGRDPRRQGSAAMGDALVRLCARAGTPPLPLLGCGAERAVVEQRGLHVVGQMRQGLVGLRCTGTGRAAQRLAGVDCAVPLRAPLRGDGTLGLRLARLGRDAPPAWRDAPRARGHPVLAIALRARCHRLGIGLGQDGLGCVPGRWHAGDPRAAGLGELVPILGARERPVGDARGGVAGGWSGARWSLLTWPNAVPSCLLPRRGCLRTGRPAWGSTTHATITWVRSGR
jgi:hypothetical protein